MTENTEAKIIAFPVPYQGPPPEKSIVEKIKESREDIVRESMLYMTEVLQYELFSNGIDKSPDLFGYPDEQVDLLKSKLLLMEALESYMCHTQGIPHVCQEIAEKLFDGDVVAEVRIVPVRVERVDLKRLARENRLSRRKKYSEDDDAEAVS